MRPTKTIVGSKAKNAILKGVNAIYNPVRATFGPEGKNALLYRTMNRGNRITNDGVTVADCQEPKDQFIRMAADTFKESCKRTNEKVGDGTTCTTILGGKLFNEIYKQIDESNNEFTEKSSRVGVMTLKKQILDSAEVIKEEILKSAKKVKTLKELEKIAIVSVEDEKIGKIVAKMAWDVGIDGFIDVIEGYKGEIETEVIKGMRFPAKVPAKAFVNNPNRYEMVAVDCPIIITNYALDNAGNVATTFKNLSNTTSKIIVVAPSFSENVLVNMVNATKNGYFFYPVLAPSLRTEQFEDLAIYCGANFIDKNKGLKLQNIRPEDIGFIEKIVVKDSENKEDAVITGGMGTKNESNPIIKQKAGFTEEPEKTKVEERIEILKGQLAETKQENFKKLLERRIASMASAIGIIRVGDSTQASSLYRKLKIEDAVYACKAGLRGGFVKGGGLCLKEIADKLDDNILKETILAPYEQIQSSVEGGIEIGEDIIDPAEAIYYAVEHATQVVANLITVDSMTVEIEDSAPEEGSYAIAKAINELVITERINKGQLKDAEKEFERDELNGMTIDEFVYLNQD
jgi:chaperonin GroEL